MIYSLNFLPLMTVLGMKSPHSQSKHCSHMDLAFESGHLHTELSQRKLKMNHETGDMIPADIVHWSLPSIPPVFSAEWMSSYGLCPGIPVPSSFHWAWPPGAPV